MRVAAGVLCLCACNRAFDLQATQLEQPDAMPACATTATYQKGLVQDFEQRCTGAYTFSEVTRRGLALCRSGPSNFTGVSEGPLDEPMTPTNITSANQIIEPRMTADGSQVWVETVTAATFKYRFEIFDRVGDNDWAPHGELDLNGGREQLLVGKYDTSAGPRVMIEADPARGNSTLVERADDGTGTWPIVVRTLVPQDLGVDYFDLVGMSPDGRRVTFAGETMTDTAIFEVDRADPADGFTPAQMVPHVPFTYSAFYMNSDCTRLYFTALDSVFYVPSTCTCR